MPRRIAAPEFVPQTVDKLPTGPTPMPPTDAMDKELRTLYLSLLAQANNVFTENMPPQQGSAFVNQYTEFFTNNTNNPVRIQMFADLVTPGAGIVFSLTRDGSDAGKLDELALTANGKVESVAIIMPANSKLYAKNKDSVFPLAAADTIRTRVFDPAKLMSYGVIFR